MSKKSFKDNPALAFISTPQDANETHEPQKTQGTQGTYDTHTPPPPKYYRLNLKLKAEYRDYLDRVSWENRKSITQYLNDLIEADRAAKDTQDTQDIQYT